MKNKDNLRVRRIMANVKGIEIEFDEYYVIDPETGEEKFDRDVEIDNDMRLYDIYKEQVNLLTSSEIKAIRKKYEMSQKEFSQAIGLGDITIHRFENGSIQTDSVDSIIRLSDNPDIMYSFLVKNQSNFEENEYIKFLKIAYDLKKIEEHRIAEFNLNEIFDLDFETIDAIDVANCLIKKYNNRVDELSKKYNIEDNCGSAEYITPLKLQKLLYYIQGLSSKIFKLPAFSNDIYAWSYGPVVNDVYQKYKGRFPISTPDNVNQLSSGLEKVIDIVVASYGQIEAERLIDLTHDEDPWINTKKNSVIKFEMIKEYFEKVYDN